MNELNFSDIKYKLALKDLDTANIHNPADAFFLLIKGLKYNYLDNLCTYIQNMHPYLTKEECYELTQNTNLRTSDKMSIMHLAINCINDGLHLGNNTINEGSINTSAWISHSIYMSKVCSTLAQNLGLDASKAETLGLLHDFGRKYDHTFNHVIVGFEKLIDLGWDSEAIGCLTHSFVKGGRCSNNEPAIDGFYIDNDGNPKFKENVKKDDITLFLENYEYSPYDIILNIADLMATANGITSPHERIADIATRRKIDPINRPHFLCDITNVLIDFLNITNTNFNNLEKIKPKSDISLEFINSYFEKVSYDFFKVYNQLSKKNVQTFNL